MHTDRRIFSETENPVTYFFRKMNQLLRLKLMARERPTLQATCIGAGVCMTLGAG